MSISSLGNTPSHPPLYQSTEPSRDDIYAIITMSQDDNIPLQERLNALGRMQKIFSSEQSTVSEEAKWCLLEDLLVEGLPESMLCPLAEYTLSLARSPSSVLSLCLPALEIIINNNDIPLIYRAKAWLLIEQSPDQSNVQAYWNDVVSSLINEEFNPERRDMLMQLFTIRTESVIAMQDHRAIDETMRMAKEAILHPDSTEEEDRIYILNLVTRMTQISNPSQTMINYILARVYDLLYHTFRIRHAAAYQNQVIAIMRSFLQETPSSHAIARKKLAAEIRGWEAHTIKHVDETYIATVKEIHQVMALPSSTTTSSASSQASASSDTDKRHM